MYPYFPYSHDYLQTCILGHFHVAYSASAKTYFNGIKLLTNFLLMKVQFYKSHMFVEFMVHIVNYITLEMMYF